MVWHSQWCQNPWRTSWQWINPCLDGSWWHCTSNGMVMALEWHSHMYRSCNEDSALAMMVRDCHFAVMVLWCSKWWFAMDAFGSCANNSRERLELVRLLLLIVRGGWHMTNAASAGVWGTSFLCSVDVMWACVAMCYVWNIFWSKPLKCNMIVLTKQSSIE